MVKAKTSVASRQRKKKILKQAKGQFGQRSRNYSQALRSVIKGLTYSYRDRKVKKREFRSLWIIRLNAACREEGISYSRFINGLTKAGVAINRKMLSELAIHEPAVFSELIKLAKNQTAQAA